MFKNIIQSARSLKNLRVLCASALLAAVYVALYSVKLPINEALRITFTFLPVAVAGWLFGVFPAVIVGAVGDVLGCLMFPQGAYFFGYTISAILGGLFFGLALYKQSGRGLLWAVVISRLLIVVLLNIGLNSYWATFFVDKGIYAIIMGKVAKNLIMLPIEIAMVYGVIIALLRAGIQKMYKNN